MFSNFKAVLFSKTALVLLLFFLSVLIANMQQALGPDGNAMTFGAAVMYALGLAVRHTFQKIIDLLTGITPTDGPTEGG